MKQKLSEKLLLLFFFGILIVSCTYEEDAIKEHNHQGEVKAKIMSYAELLKNSQFSKAIKRIPKKKVAKTDEFGRTTMEETYGFTIIDAPIKVVEIDGKTSYTLQIISDDNIENNLENLILYPNSNDVGYIVTYNAAKDEQSSGNQIVEQGIADIKPITNTNNNENEKFWFLQILTYLCTDAGGPEDCCGFDGGDCYVISNIFLSFGSQSDGDSTWSGDSGTNSSGTGNSGYNNTNSNEPLLLTPTQCHGAGCATIELEDEAEEETPCEQLKKLSEPTKQNINPAIQELKNKVIAGATKEWGQQFKKDRSYDASIDDNITTYSNELKEGINYEVVLSAGQVSNGNGVGNYLYFFGGAHTHPIDGCSMFSWGDVKALQIWYNQFDNYLSDEVSCILVCNNPADPANPLVYSIKVDDITKLNTKINDDWTNPKYAAPNDKKKKENIFKELSEGYEKNKSHLERHFLQFYADYGISLYKAENDMSNWNKLTLGTGTGNTQQVVPTPCTN